MLEAGGESGASNTAKGWGGEGFQVYGVVVGCLCSNHGHAVQQGVGRAQTCKCTGGKGSGVCSVAHPGAAHRARCSPSHFEPGKPCLISQHKYKINAQDSNKFF